MSTQQVTVRVVTDSVTVSGAAGNTSRATVVATGSTGPQGAPGIVQSITAGTGVTVGGSAGAPEVTVNMASGAETAAGSVNSKAVTPASLVAALPFPDVQQFGVVFDGVTNDRTNLNSYIADCAADGRPCFLRAGTFQISGGSLAGAGVIRGAGRGKTVIRQGSTNAGVLDFDSKSDWEVSDLTLESDASATHLRSLWIRGEGERGSVHRVQVTNGGLYVSGGDASFDTTPNPTTPGFQKRLVLDSVWVDDAGEYGISLDSVQGADLIAPQITSAAVDGIKMLHSCDDVTVTGGFATLCGQEGLDAFMGGRNLTIVGFKAFDNTGNGITVKSDDNLYDPGNIQLNAQVTLVGVICRGNGAYGLTIDRNGAVDDPLIWLLSHVTVHGGVFEDNTQAGIKVRARNVSLVAPACRRNGQQGIYFLPEAMDCDVVSPQVSGNSQTTVNTYDGILVAGIRTRVFGGYSIGKDADTITADGDYAALTAQQRYGAVIASGSTDCEIHDTIAFGNATGDVVSFGTGGMIRTRTNFQIAGAVEVDGALNHDGTTVGFYGTAPVAKQTGVAVSAAGVHAALVNLGLISA